MRVEARLLTPEEVRAELGPEAEGKTDEELTLIARRVRAITRVIFETRAASLRTQRPPDGSTHP